ncbi:MAG: hypothetical protein KC549_14350 [Myxococcales bacterium]|nr:hypothetical protein [Myxococcales bacterium]
MCPRPLPLLLLTACLGLLSGCGGYANTSEAFRKSLGRGAPDQALGRVNEALGVDRPDQLPSEKEADTPLLLLERGTILQAMGRYEDSARDFQAADSMIDVLDLSSDGIGSLGKYLFSDDATLYKAPPHEKLLLNTFNMVNYLALGDAGGAKVEARRLVISSKYLENIGESDARRMLALASYLAGFAFEAAGEADQAMRHYADAYAAGGLPTLDEAIRHLHATRGATDPRVAELLAGGEAEGAPGTADLVVVVQTGMAPFREPVRVPIANAILLTHRDGHARLSAADQRRAQVMATKGLLKWVNYPRLRRVGRRRATGAVQVDGRTLPGGAALDVEGRVLEEFERAVPSLVAASITRLLARAVAGELSQAATKKGSGNGLAGLLVGLAVEGAMVAADTPDTRGWVTLPASVYVARMRVPAGKRRVTVAFGAETQEVMVDLPAGGWKLLNFSAAR